jgi:aryl-alcohol dehydrogenase-like predicted oxidoreductase
MAETKSTMQYARLGNTGMKVSRICLGMMTYGTPTWREWVLNEEQSFPLIKQAWDAGINFFDTADMYSKGKSEEVLGNALKSFQIKRDEVVVASKVYFPFDDKPNAGGLSRKHIMSACDASLKRLGTDYIDLYQIHRWDYDTPIEETMGKDFISKIFRFTFYILEALHDLVRAGKVRYIGASSMHAWQFSKALYIAEQRGMTQFVSMQNHYNLIYRYEMIS